MPRTPDEPLPQQIFEFMQLCEPYTVSDISSQFNEASRWTIQRRLDTLVEAEKISKKTHDKNRVTYWIKKRD